MQRVKTATAVANKPPYSEAGTPAFFTAGDAVAAIPATAPGQDWFNMTQEELLNLIKAAGLVPSATDDTQLREAVIKLIVSAVAGHNESGTAHADIWAALAGINIPAASEAVAGIIKLATAAQVAEGTNTERAITPAGLAARTSTSVRAGIVELATAEEVLAGTDTERAITSAALLAGLLGAGGGGTNDFVTIPYRNRTTGTRDNLILQWGVTPDLSCHTYVDITLPIAFPVSAFAAMITGINTDGSIYKDNMPQYKMTRTTLSIFAQATSGNLTACPYAWIAIGR